ncbi:MAG: COQ9 family protein [Asticcacaulis sp.]|uniref:COQ9 family protein n=1 Tax=Asticcacaulis sp. TaxID=1872648 RepID=UPI0039E58103
MTMSAPLSGIKAAESRLAKAVAAYIPELGLNRQSVEAGAYSLGFGDGERDLIAPHGAPDIAAILWRGHDEVLLTPETAESLAGMKIREKIGYLLNLRLDEAAQDEKLAKRLMGFFALPQNAALYHRLLWETAGTIWRLAGDKALDENHYSKRLIVSGIITTAMMTRLSRGRDAQLEQIDRNIEQVMQFEKFKAKLPVKPEEIALNLARTLGRLRFGHDAA